MLLHQNYAFNANITSKMVSTQNSANAHFIQLKVMTIFLSLEQDLLKKQIIDIAVP